MNEKLNRREWIFTVGTGLAALHFGIGCRFWPKQEKIKARAWVFGAIAEPEAPGKSIVYWADFQTYELRQISVPVQEAHKIVSVPDSPYSAYVIGLESSTVCRLNLRAGNVADVFSLGKDGYVSSGHAAYVKYKGEDALFLSEYRRKDPKKGSVCIRRLKDFSVMRRFSSQGSYPHVVVFRPKAKELVVQNLGHRAAEESYSATSELVVFDWPSLKIKKRVKPGREGRPYYFLNSRGKDSEENFLFRKTVSYQLDTRRTFYPETGVQTNEHPHFHSFTQWTMADNAMRLEKSLGGIEPTHMVGPDFLPFFVLNEKGGGLHLVLKNNLELVSPREFRDFHSDMHLSLLYAPS